MKLQDVYFRLQQESKINDDNYLAECLEFYKKSTRAVGTDGNRRSKFYAQLVETSKSIDQTNINTKSEAEFYVMMTNIWIENILSLTDKDIEQLKQNGLPRYKEIKEIVSTVKKVNSMEEVISLYNTINQRLDEMEMDKKGYFWRYDQDEGGTIFSKESNSGFYHVQSRHVNARKTNNHGNTDYRLYVNCQSSDVFELCKLYVELCRKKQIPYYFKYMIKKDRKDKFLIYCSKELLLENINILKEISKIKPEISKNCGEMLSLVGNIDNWIGISSEPKQIAGKAKFSFNTMRAEILEDAAELTILNFIDENKGKIINYNGQQINFDLNLAKRAANIIIEEMIADKKINKNDPNLSRYIKDILMQLTKKINGISPIDMAFKKMRDVLPEKNNLWGSNSKPIFTIKLINGQEFEFSLYKTDKLLKEMLETMKKIDPKYIEKYRQIIKEKCIEYQVDPDNFAFNLSSLSEFKNIDIIEQENAKLNKNQTGRWNRKNFEYVSNLLSNISEDVLMLRLENNMTLKQYFLEVLVDRMDENYNYINDDGSLTPVSNIIKDQIYKCVSGKEGKWNEKNFYYVSGIISTLNEDILNTKIGELEELKLAALLYNNISLKQYFQEVLVDRMDENQNFINFDRKLVPVTKYILSIVNKINERSSRYEQVNSKKII